MHEKDPELMSQGHSPLYTQDSTERLTAFGSSVGPYDSAGDHLQTSAVRSDLVEEDSSSSPRIAALPGRLSYVANHHNDESPTYISVSSFSTVASEAPNLDQAYARYDDPS